MIFVKAILIIIALFITLLWVTKLITDCVYAMYGKDFSDESAQKDGVIRFYMIGLMSILWGIISVL